MKKLIVAMVILLLVLSGCSKEEQVTVPSQAPQVIEQNDPVANSEQPQEPQLSGAVLVMVDNYAKARPQSDLDKADMVYEMMAEGGITRFMALFYQQSAEKIGPIRSARYYFVQLAKGYDSPLAHAGGSTEALQMLVDLKVKDLDEIYNSGGYFWRTKDRKMPHNLYSSTQRLVEGAKEKGYSLVPLPILPTATEWEGEEQPGNKDIVIDYSAGTYKYLVNWYYDEGKYKRNINGKPHLMEDGVSLSADNIIILKAETKTVLKDNIPLSEIKIIDKGEAQYFINGKIIKGSWKKDSAEKGINFLDIKGDPMKFKSGNIWIQVIPDWSSVTLQ